MKKNKYLDKIELTLIPEEVNGRNYNNFTNCPIAEGLKKLGYEKVFVGGTYFEVEGECTYSIPPDFDDVIHSACCGDAPLVSPVTGIFAKIT